MNPEIELETFKIEKFNEIRHTLKDRMILTVTVPQDQMVSFLVLVPYGTVCSGF